MEEFNASLKGSFDKFVTKITDPMRQGKVEAPAAAGLLGRAEPELTVLSAAPIHDDVGNWPVNMNAKDRDQIIIRGPQRLKGYSYPKNTENNLLQGKQEGGACSHNYLLLV